MNDTNRLDTGFPFDAFAKRSKEVFFSFNPDTNKLLFVNEAFDRVWQMSKESIDSDLSHFINTIHPDDKQLMSDVFLQIKEVKEKHDVQFRIVLNNEKIKWLTASVFFIDYEGVDTIIGIASDITSLKDYNATLHKFNDKKNAALTIVSHDLTAPLATIKTIIDLVQKNMGLNNVKDIDRLLQIANQTCERSITVIHDLINQEFLESSEVKLNRQRVDLVLNLREIVNQYRQVADETKRTFRLHSFTDTLFINIDESKFMQVINNLISNAIKFTHSDGNIDILIEEAADTILIKVSDNGIGIPDNLQPFLFDKFTKAKRRGIKGEPTVGLGMSIVKTIVEWHKGKIRFETEEGNGTTFIIELPKDN